ncbi:MAG TPA: tRNA (adenosine(37)-N6)-threonylcarbamoyltransferase complex dimerization subunit type 1 TsaB [Aquabacterium sp.]|nr:tRNA (adenosine(37)-N6)-threonylcarbamoyltransferase complex dimerization subunit type 1 TsaB [Aquabacterium sp.]HQC98522.1 tRNA (adenosine(37)-N6)-threonylcarbamoyltransferase complex dimerization subunit type 1 TsaB [Aquabacterium sp.]
MTPILLALDTATDRLAAGLLAPGGRWAVDEAGGAAASARLLPLLMNMLAQAGLTMPQVQAVAFGQGPGAFTGLRTACAVAQGLAFAHGTPVLPVDSLCIVAEDARAQAVAAGEDGGGLWWVAMDARMDEVYAAAYRDGAQGWAVDVAPQLWTLPALAAAWQAAPPQRVAGSAIDAFADRLPWGDARRWPTCADRGGALLRLAEAAWVAGAAIPAEAALPLYLRDKVALTTAERAAAAAGAPR